MSETPPVPAAQWFASLPTFLANASALITDPGGAALIVKPNYRPGWNLPGGVLEADESPRACCAREVVEELGLAIEVGRLLVVDWLPAAEIRRAAFGFVFDCGILADAALIRLQREELEAFEFVTPDEAMVRLPGYAAARLQAALRVRAGDSVAYTHDGVPAFGG